MPDTSSPTEDSADAPTSAFADLCTVQRGAGGSVVMLFGQRTAAGPGLQGAELRQRVALGADGAARLQDLMTALLQGGEPPPAR
jgi:hypothetical protein